MEDRSWQFITIVVSILSVFIFAIMLIAIDYYKTDVRQTKEQLYNLQMKYNEMKEEKQEK